MMLRTVMFLACVACGGSVDVAPASDAFPVDDSATVDDDAGAIDLGDACLPAVQACGDK